MFVRRIFLFGVGNLTFLLGYFNYLYVSFNISNKYNENLFSISFLL